MLDERVEEWTENWKQAGVLQGLQQGEITLLERQLNRRFGPISAETHACLKNAALDQIEQWADNILDAATLDDVFK